MLKVSGIFQNLVISLMLHLVSQMGKAFLDEHGLLPHILGILHIGQAVEVLRMALAAIMNILHEKYKIHKLVEAGLTRVIRPLSGHDDEVVQEYIAAIFHTVSESPGLETWLVSDECELVRGPTNCQNHPQ